MRKNVHVNIFNNNNNSNSNSNVNICDKTCQVRTKTKAT